MHSMRAKLLVRDGRRINASVLATLTMLLLATSAPAVASPLAPSAPSNLTATSGEPTVRLTWEAAQANGAPIDHYNVYRACSSCELRVTNVGNVTSYEDVDVSGGTTYTYEVAAVNALGEEGPRASVESTPAVPGLPGPPRDLRAETLSSKNHYGTLLTWSAADDGGSKILRYKVYRDVGNGWALLDTVRGSTLQYEDRHGRPGERNCSLYSYSVTAENANGEGPRSAAVVHGPGSFACPPE